MARINLPLDLYSPDQLSIVIMELRENINALRDSAARKKAGGPDEELPHVSALLVGVLRFSGVVVTDQNAQEKLMHELEVIRDKAPAAHVTLAALPNRTLKRQITQWFREQINPYTLLTFAVRADIGGGIVIRAGSRVYDFSFKQQLVRNKNRISEIYDAIRAKADVRQ